MRIIDITEKRANAKLNPKVSVNQEIITALNSNTGLIAGITNCFVSFTALEKLGINPQSTYDTPIGIYAYPAEYVVKKASETSQMVDALPFAGEQPFANIFSVKGNIINLKTVSEDEVTQYYSSLMKKFKSSKTIKELIKRAATKKRTGKQLWTLTWKISNNLSPGKPAIVWNKLFRLLGIDGCVDPGRGIIHENEPTQAVFFSISSIVRNKRVANSYSPSLILSRQNLGMQNSQSTKLSRELDALQASSGEDAVASKLKTLSPTEAKSVINLLSPKLQEILLSLNPMLFLELTSPPSINAQKMLLSKAANIALIRPKFLDPDLLFNALFSPTRTNKKDPDYVLSISPELVEKPPFNTYFTNLLLTDPKKILNFKFLINVSPWLSRTVFDYFQNRTNLLSQSEIAALNSLLSKHKLKLKSKK